MQDEPRRTKEIGRLRWKLESDSFPRLQMTLIVALTGGAGLLASYLLLRLGLTEMWLRYLCAVGFAYLAFLFLLWLWLRTQASDYVDAAPDLTDLIPTPGRGGSAPQVFSGKGGSFDGGGASGSFEVAEPPAVAFNSSGKVGEAIGSAADADELVLPLIVIALFAVVILSSAWIIYSAPALFAELLLDGALATGLYRRLRKIEARNWLETALRKTVLPFIATAALVSACGWGMQAYAPEAVSIGQVIAHARQLR